MIEMFDLRGKQLKYVKELLLNHYRKPAQNFVRLQDTYGQSYTVVTNHFVGCCEVVYTRQQNAVVQPG